MASNAILRRLMDAAFPRLLLVDVFGLVIPLVVLLASLYRLSMEESRETRFSNDSVCCIKMFCCGCCCCCNCCICCRLSLPELMEVRLLLRECWLLLPPMLLLRECCWLDVGTVVEEDRIDILIHSLVALLTISLPTTSLGEQVRTFT